MCTPLPVAPRLLEGPFCPPRVAGAFFVVLVLLALACSRPGVPAREQNAPAYEPIAPGEPAPAFERPLASGGAVRVGAGEPATLLNFWATWCGPCLEEFPDLERIHRELPRLRVLALNVDELDAAAVRAFADGLGATFPLVLDPPGDLVSLYRVDGMPTSLLIDTGGIVRRVWVGRLPGSALDELRLLVP